MRTVMGLALVALSGCTYLNEQDLDDRLDLDGDSVPAPEDCDPDDPERAIEADFFADGDGDGAGDPLTVQTFCGAPPAGWVANALDQCPDNAELTSPALWWEDLDGDGFGNENVPLSDCSSNPAEGRAYPGIPDCDDEDANATVLTTWYPDSDGDGLGTTVGAEDRCGPPDEEHSAQPGDSCDGEPTLFEQVTYYYDHDQDGIGSDTRVPSCSPEPGYRESAESGDCDDSVASIGGPTDYYLDDDADGYGRADQPQPDCDGVPAGHAERAGDCDDTDELIHPDQQEFCDGVDQNCDGNIDESLDDYPFVTDNDNDGYPANLTDLSYFCGPEDGFLLLDGAPDEVDCDDNDENRNPGLEEDFAPDGFDEDCNPLNNTDEDEDGADRYTDPVDCDDTDPTIRPGVAEEIGDGIDNDCDPATLDGDGDGDGYEDVMYGGMDCDDTNASVFPGQVERVEADGQEVDDNCTGGHGAECGRDEDLDGYGDANEMLVVDIDKTDSCANQQSIGFLDVGVPGDCNDADALAFPGAVEACDGIDRNCDGDADTSLVTQTLGDGDPVQVLPGVHVIDAVRNDGVRIDVCSNSSSPIPIALDITTPSDVVVVGLWTGGTVRPDDGGVQPVEAFLTGDAPANDGQQDRERPVLAPLAGGQPIVQQRGAGRTTLFGVNLTGDGVDDIDVSAGEVVGEDGVWTALHVHASSDGQVTVEDGVSLAGESWFELATGRLELDGLRVFDQGRPLVVATGGVVLLDDLLYEDGLAPVVQASGGTAITAFGVSASGATGPLYDVGVASVTDVGSVYRANDGAVFAVSDAASIITLDTELIDNQGVVAGTGGSTLMIGGVVDGHVDGPLFDTDDHDVSLEGVTLGSNDPVDQSLFELTTGDLSLVDVSFDACPAYGVAWLGGGNLEVEGASWDCDAQQQVSPLFDVVGDVDLEDVIVTGETALAPALVRAEGGRVVMARVESEGKGVPDIGFDPFLPVIDLQGADATLTAVTIDSTQCDGTGCVGVTGIAVVDTTLICKGLSTTSGGPGVDLQGSSYYGHGGVESSIGSSCDGTETQNHVGPRAMVIDDIASASIFGCSDSSARFAGCFSSGTIVPVECAPGEDCVCVAIAEELPFP